MGGFQVYYTRSRLLPRLLRLLPARVRRHHTVRTVVDYELALVFPTVLDGERPNGGIVGEPVPKKLRRFVQPRVALLSNHLRPVRNGLLHELDHCGLGFENVTRGIVFLDKVGPEG